MLKKNKTLLILAALAAAAYFLFFRKKAGAPTSTVDPVVIKRYPKPGYSGPVNGPFTWASVGTPPNGEYNTIGWTESEYLAAGFKL